MTQKNKNKNKKQKIIRRGSHDDIFKILENISWEINPKTRKFRGSHKTGKISHGIFSQKLEKRRFSWVAQRFFGKFYQNGLGKYFMTKQYFEFFASSKASYFIFSKQYENQ